MEDIISQEPEPINWHDWKDVLVRVGIPVCIAVGLGYLLIDASLHDTCLQNFTASCGDW